MEMGRQALRSPDDWWAIVLGSGYCWTVERLGTDAAEQVRLTNLDQIHCRNLTEVETNAIFDTAHKSDRSSVYAARREQHDARGAMQLN